MPSQLTNHIRPFSHRPGETCMLPSSSWKLTAYPTQFELENLAAEEEKILFSFEAQGPIQGYTLMQDLERDFVRIYGTAKRGYFSFRLTAEPDAIVLLVERCPDEGLPFSFQGVKEVLKRKQTYAFPLSHKQLTHPHEKTHFGCHKKQDWTLLRRRLSLSEILPLWFALGRKCPKEQLHYEGTATLFKACEKAIQGQDRVQVGSLLLQLFQVGFGGMLTPRLLDTDFQGILPPQKEAQGSPLILLSHGADLIRMLFLSAQGDTIEVLPCLPVELHSGRAVNLQVSEHLNLDLEWSKKTLRRLTLRSNGEQTWKLKLQNDLKSYRLDGKRVSIEDPLALEAGKTYLLDRFEK
ncbi:glycoside hydrolase family 95-like protein [Simkania sp.]|uniref:glycoside hydrolase family 95-like protein n=1 Tax=Simkania sp. TaxID=34094 RepID=UPI003B51C456